MCIFFKCFKPSIKVFGSTSESIKSDEIFINSHDLEENRRFSEPFPSENRRFSELGVPQSGGPSIVR